MIRLTQTFGAHAGRVREFEQDVVRCGRLPTNDFAFDPHADLDASGNHAEIRREGARWILVDAGSRNGTLVNGRPVQRQVLEPNDEIEFGTGGPRVKVEIVQGGVPPGALRPGQPTAPATPIDAIGDMAPPTAGGVSPPPPIAPVWTGGGNSPAPQYGTPAPMGGSLPNEARRYGQRTLDIAVEAAETRGRVQGAASAGPIDAPRAPDAASQQNRTVIYALGAMVVLLLCLVCLLGAALAFVAFRH